MTQTQSGEDPTEVQNLGLSLYMYSCENLTNHEVPIVMVPFPAQGHLNQLLQLSCLISSYGLPVYYVGSATHNGQARFEPTLNPSDIAKVHFHDLPTPEFDSPSPDFNALNKFPSHLQPSPLLLFLRCDISSKARRVIVVHDPLMSYNVQDVSSLPNVPSLEGIMADEARDFSTFQHQYMDIRSGDIHNTSKVIEGKFLDLLEQAETNLNKKQWAIGPGNQGGRDGVRAEEARKVELPEGFKERVKEVGLVVREWAPQPEILAHSIYRGFMSHCGWNSCIESITMGVPIAAWPMHSDQPINGFFLTEILKIGLLVREWEKREELVSASTIENVVRKLMASEEGDLIRKRAEELGEAVRRSTERGGASNRVGFFHRAYHKIDLIFKYFCYFSLQETASDVVFVYVHMTFMYPHPNHLRTIISHSHKVLSILL
ncbi:hypothetical protein H5410_064780 [Solanum commersonii]|uniref:Glycosyltransferase n=1 Tax=Solanum commersonii TaxID=4109 RepID=A0A9J5VYD9_SOLCO|nr:hypothetical protein H5410_064780 [Solanum commersonii]